MKMRLLFILPHTSLGKNWTGWDALVDSDRFGMRDSCEKSGTCPPRWDSCAVDTASEANQKLRFNVGIFQHESFCANLRDIDASAELTERDMTLCSKYVEGMVLDANLVFEEQLGVTLVAELSVNPKALELYIPALATASTGSTPESVVSEIDKKICSTDTSFFDLFGREVDTFAAFVVLYGNGDKLIVPEENKSVSTPECGCKNLRLVKYENDTANKETWRLFSKALGFVLNSKPYYTEAGKTFSQEGYPEGGIMGNGKGTDQGGIFKFNDVHKKNICERLNAIKTKQCVAIANFKHYSSFLKPLRHGSMDGWWFLVLLGLAILLPLLLLLCCLLICCCFHKKYKKNKLRLDELAEEKVALVEKVTTERNTLIKQREEFCKVKDEKMTIVKKQKRCRSKQRKRRRKNGGNVRESLGIVTEATVSDHSKSRNGSASTDTNPLQQ